MPKKWTDGLSEFVNGLKQKLWKEANSWTYGWLKPEGQILSSEKVYVEMRLHSMRVPFQRIIGKKYFGAVHSFISLDTKSGSGKAAFNVVTTPTDLQKIDPQNVSNVIQRKIPILGPVPYIGGDIMVEAGVFSILEQDLVAPFLKVAEDISDTAGIDIVSKAIPFIQPLQNAIYSVIGASDKNKLEIGIKMPLTQEGYLAVVGVGSTDDYLSDVELKKDGRLFKNKKEIKEPYMVLTVQALKRRPNISSIPDVLLAWQNLKNSIASWDEKTILEMFAVYKKTVLKSFDLLLEDALLIVEETDKELVQPILKQIRARGKPKPTPTITLLDAEHSLDQFYSKIKSR